MVDIADVVDIRNDENLNCIYVIYQMGGFVVAYDDEFIRVYEVDGSVSDNSLSSITISDKPTKEIMHGLGYTPARQFWTNQLNPKNFINKESPITKELSDLDWLLFHMTSKKHMDVANA